MWYNSWGNGDRVVGAGLSLGVDVGVVAATVGCSALAVDAVVVIVVFSR